MKLKTIQNESIVMIVTLGLIVVALNVYAKCEDYKPSNDNTYGACGCSYDDFKPKGSACTIKTFSTGKNGTCDCGSGGCQDGSHSELLTWTETSGTCGLIGCKTRGSGTTTSGTVKIKVAGCPGS